MTATQSLKAKQRWQKMSDAERRQAAEPMVQASSERRRTAHALLGALEAAGIKVEVVAGDEVPTS